jgi:hypothetical protein
MQWTSLRGSLRGGMSEGLRLRGTRCKINRRNFKTVCIHILELVIVSLYPNIVWSANLIMIRN